MKSSYPQELTDLAKENGYKAANLGFLDQILLEFNREQGEGIAIEVPKHISVSNQLIVTHLNKYAPLWQEKWQEFIQAQGDSSESLTPLAIDKLREIQGMIQASFNGSNEITVEGIDKDAKQMVRSTGDEDRVDVANPGGNDSVPSDGDSVSESIGIVISSYFSEKSMLQRLKSGEDITKRPPLMPCLIQELVGETSKDQLPPVSGVIYTDERNIRIQAAYGHGELVVSSRGNFDNAFVTNEDVVHQYIGDKKVRIVPIVNQDGKKIELEEVDNKEFAKNSSLNEDLSMRLAKFSRFVQNKYGMRMDIEFVYDANSNKINIVQARPIPEGKRRGVAPSALSNDFISQEKPKHIDGEIITPDIMVTKVITNKDEVIVCRSIDQALTSYLKNKDNKVKAVIIDKTAPDTSHEAGFFTSQSIPVIYADDYDDAKNWVQELDNNVLVIDPQHAAIYQISKDQYQDNLIEEGIFQSTLAEYVTPIKREFSQGPSRELPEVEAQTIGGLVIEARTNPEATQRLFRYVHNEIGIRETKLYGKEEIKEDLKKLLTFPGSEEEFLQQKKTLADLLNFITSIKNNQEIASSTYEQLIITGVELYKAISEVEDNPKDPGIKLNYLNIHQKLNGLISSKGKNGIFSTSLFNEIAKHDQREILKTEVIEAGFSLSNIDESRFLNLAQHKNNLINDQDRQKWMSFCYKACQVPETVEKLESLVNDIIQLDLKDYWLNVNFISAYENNPDNAIPDLAQELKQNLESSEDILKAAKLIDRMEHQIVQWSDPKNFKTLFEKELQNNIQEITKLIKFDDKNKLSSSLAIKQLYRLVDTIDLSMKKLQNSPLYENKEIQVQNFKLMLGEFFQVMENQVGDIHSDRMQDMKSFFQSKDRSTHEDELKPSKDFSVIQADFFQNEGYGFELAFGHVRNKKLSDLYTLVHQTLLTSIGRKSANYRKDLMKILPEFVKEIDTRILGDRSSTFKNYENKNVDQLEKLYFLYIDQAEPYINLHYNIPLRSHSGNLELKYNINTKSIELDFMMFGISDIRSNRSRWNRLEESAFLLFEVFTDAKLISHKSTDNTLNFNIEISNETKGLKEVFEILNTISHSTNDSARGLYQAFDDKNGELVKIMQELGLSSFMINAHRDAQENIDFKALHKVVQSLKSDSSKEIRISLEKEALIRLMAMDENGVVNYSKIKEIISKEELNIMDLVDKESPKLSIYGYAVLTNYLVSKKYFTNAIKVANIIMLNSESQSFFVNKCLSEVSMLLIDNNLIEESFLITNKLNEKSLLPNIAIKFIEKNDLKNAFEIIDHISSEYYLADIAIKFIEKNAFKNAFKVIDKITNGYVLSKISNEFIESNDLANAFKIIDKIYDQYYLSEIANKLIEEDYPTEVAKVIKRIETPTSLQIAYLAENDLVPACSNHKPFKKHRSGWSVLPVVEAIDEGNYRQVESGFVVSEFEKLDYSKNRAKEVTSNQYNNTSKFSHPIGNYTDFINQYNPQVKHSEYKARLTDFLQNKLPETDMTAVAVIAARAAKFFVNKLGAGKKSEAQEKKHKLKQFKKDKGMVK